MMRLHLFHIVLWISVIVPSFAESFPGENSDASTSDSWTGRWFPHKPLKLKSDNSLPEELTDPSHGVVMGVSSPVCDDGKSNLSVDWDNSAIDYTCYTPKSSLSSRFDLEPVLQCDDIPPNYTPQHYCMSDKLVYNVSIPTHEAHRPLWPKFGEYKYVPPQRWLHNIEHGAVVMLYHPCTPDIYVQRLRTIVTGCIRKHVITPYISVPKDTPLVLVTWGCRLYLPYVDVNIAKEAIKYIRERALHGGEGHYSKEGQYDEHLEIPAEIPLGSDYNDSHLCPFFP